jgi:hypothetical protein
MASGIRTFIPRGERFFMSTLSVKDLQIALAEFHHRRAATAAIGANRRVWQVVSASRD